MTRIESAPTPLVKHIINRFDLATERIKGRGFIMVAQFSSDHHTLTRRTTESRIYDSSGKIRFVDRCGRSKPLGSGPASLSPRFRDSFKAKQGASPRIA